MLPEGGALLYSGSTFLSSSLVQVRDNGSYFFVDASDDSRSNWMR